MRASCSRTRNGRQGSHKDKEKLDFNTQKSEKESKLHCTGDVCLFVVYSVAPFLFGTFFFDLSPLHFKAAALRPSVVKRSLKRTALNTSFGVD